MLHSDAPGCTRLHSDAPRPVCEPGWPGSRREPALALARAEGDEERIELLEGLAHPVLVAGPGVESFLRWIEVVHDHQRLACLFFEGHRGDGTAVSAFLIGPDEACVWLHFDVRTEERHL